MITILVQLQILKQTKENKPNEIPWKRHPAMHAAESKSTRKRPRPGCTAIRFVTLFGLCLSLTAGSAYAIDMENGEEINEVCAGCHGEFGQGGKAGEYPRLAGMPGAH